MFSGFRSPTLISRKNILQQENNVAARKPGQLSARKPFTERSNIDIKDQNTPLIKPKTIVKPVVVQIEPEIDLSEHVMTLKEAKDNYCDLFDERLLLGRKGIQNIYKNLLYGNEFAEREKEPIFEEDFLEKSLEIERNFDDEGFEDVCDVFDNNYDNLKFDDNVPFPEIDFDF